MPAHRRTVDQREQDLATLARLIARGVEDQGELTAAVNADKPPERRVTRQQVSYDVQRLRERWSREVQDAGEQWQGRLLNQLLLAQREAWDAWERSKQPREVTRTRRHELPQRGKDGQAAAPLIANSAEVTTEQQVGDPRFLEAYMRASDRIAKLLGLFEPDAVQLTLGMLRSVVDPHIERLSRETGVPQDQVRATILRALPLRTLPGGRS